MCPLYIISLQTHFTQITEFNVMFYFTFNLKLFFAFPYMPLEWYTKFNKNEY